MRNKFMTGMLCLMLAGLLPSPALAAKKDKAAETAKKNETKPLTLEEHIERGSQLIQRRDYAGAIKEYESALKLDVKNAKANLLLGLTYANTGDINKAIRYTMQSITTEPSYSAYHNLGLMYANKGDYKQSIEFHKKSLSINPSSYRGWYQLGLVQQANSQYTDAVESYRKSIESNPKFIDAYIGMGGAYYWSGNLQGALDQVKKLKELGASSEAGQLEAWIQNKEAKKAQGQKPRAEEAKPSANADAVPAKIEAAAKAK